MYEQFKDSFPRFYQRLQEGKGNMEEIEPPLAEQDIAAVESRTGVLLSNSYKRLLRCSQGFWLLGGVIQVRSHLFFHDFSNKPSWSQNRFPPTQGMLCFGDFWWEADGDQILFDVSKGLIDGEYPVVYYPHENPLHPRRIADSFEDWLNEVLDYPELN